MICGGEVLGGVLLLCIGFENVAVDTNVAFLIAMDVAVLLTGWFGRGTGAWSDTVFLIQCS